MSNQPTLLIILDGFGYNPDNEYNAIAKAQTPNFNHWFKTYPYTYLKASGEAVGLTPNTIGTSEVGHQTIGAGRIIPESVVRINQAIDDGSFFKNETLLSALAKIKKNNGRLHLMGLLSDAGVHSHEQHLFALIKAAQEQGIPTFIHAFLDGRDVPPRSAATYLAGLARICKQDGCSLASIHGRFYAMDRDNNWERTEQTYRVLTQQQKDIRPYSDEFLRQQYDKGVSDEFIPPTQLDPNGIIRPGDGVIFFNFRADRARQLTRCFITPHTARFAITPLKLSCFVGMTDYDHDVRNEALLAKEQITHTLKDELARADLTMFSIAETEKYAHVTYFFGGGREQELPGEELVMIPSIKTHNYVAHPEMSAKDITNTVLKSLQTDPYDFYLINYANADMVGHSGDFEATVKAVECLDRELQKLYEMVVHQMNGTMYVTADHGNAELMFDEETLQPKTSHTLNPVPFLILRKGLEHRNLQLPLTGLADIAPFILKELKLPVPVQMQRKD
jgi:2,3-bisphosphoglycerate-independent phosphoglycerate mutase